MRPISRSPPFRHLGPLICIQLVLLFLFDIFFITEAHLTKKERNRIVLAAKGQNQQPDFCSACLYKALANHFPHACLISVPDPIALASQPGQMDAAIFRCVCIAFIDPQWMRQDCTVECEFARHDKVFEMIPKIGGFPGCEPWVDLDNMVELEVEGYEKRDPLHKPKAYDLQAEQQAASDTMKTLAAGILEKDRKVSEGKDREDEEAKEDEGGEEGKKMEEGNEHTTNTDLEIANEKDTAVVKNVAAVAAGESTHPMNETTTSTWKDRKVSKEEDMNIDEDSGSGWLAKGLKDEL